MANTVSLLSYTNTFGDWLVSTNALVNENNTLATNTYIKSTGTLILNDPNLGLQVANNSIFGGQLQVRGVGSSSYIQNNLEVEGQVYFSNTTLGLVNYGQANIGGTLFLNSNNLGIVVANNSLTKGNVYVSGITQLNDRLFVTGNSTFSNAVNISGTTTIANSLFVTGYANSSYVVVENDAILGGNLYAVNGIYNGRVRANLSISTNVLTTNTLTANSRINTNDLTAYSITANSAVTSQAAISNNLITNVATSNTIAANVITTGLTTSNTVTANVTISGSSTSNTVTANTITSGLTTSNTVTANAIASRLTTSNTVTANAITSGLTTSNTVTANVITTGLTTSNTVTANVIISGSSTSNAVTANAITSGLTTSNTVTANTITSGLTTSNAVIANTITSGLTTSNTVTANTITSGLTTSNTVTANAITSGLTTSNTITSNAATFNRISANNITANGNIIVETLNVNSILAASNADAYVKTMRAYSDVRIGGNLNIEGDFRIDGTTIYNTDKLVISANNAVGAEGFYGVNRGSSGANAMIRWYESGKYWDILDVNNSTYNRILTANLISDSLISSSTATVASSNALYSYISSVSYAGTSGSASPNAGRITLTSTNGITVVGSSNTITINTAQDLRTSANPTFATLTTSNTVTANAITTGLTTSNTVTANVITTGLTTSNTVTANAITTGLTTSNTITANVITTGNISAVNLIGSGTNLTSLNASNLSTGTVPNARLSSIPNSSIANTAVTIGATSVSLGSTATNFSGVSLSSPTFTSPTLGTPLSGNLGNCTFPTLNQSTTGSAASLTTARTLTIGSTGKSFNGTGDVSWSLSEIGVTGALSAYLPLSGGTLTGRVVQSASGFKVATKDVINTRTDSGFYETNVANTTNGWPQTTGGWYHLLTSTHSNDANYYSMQFAGHFDNSNDIYYRTTSNNGNAAWNKLWHAGNDGSGSGLDADLLDGQNGSYYTSNTYVDATFFKKSGGEITGPVTITGNLTVIGNTTTVTANNLSIKDNMIYLNQGLSGNVNPDLGFAGAYNDGIYHHAGFFRDASDGVWKVFDNYLPEPDASPYIDTSNNTFRLATFQANNIISSNSVSAISYTGSNATLSGSLSAGSVTITGNTTLKTSLSGLAKLASGVVGVATADVDYVTPSGTTTLSNKRITQRTNITTTTTSPWSINTDSYDIIGFTGLANALTINADSGTPTQGQKIMIRLKDDGTSRALTWTTSGTKSWRAIGTTLPISTTANKITYVGAVYNTNESVWDVIAVTTQA